MIKVVFMGTPAYAATILEGVLASPVAEVIAVFTQPDKPVGRKQVLTPSEVKLVAEAHNIPIYQPRHVKREKWVNILKELAPDLIVVAAFGQIISQEILDIPPMGCINSHGSLLPKYRGAAPIQWCIADGETKTGVTAMMMDAGIDTGAMILKSEVEIDPTDTAETLSAKMAEAGAAQMQEVLRLLSLGELPTPEPQDDALAGEYARMLTKKDGEADFTMPARLLDCRVRAFRPWPGVYTELEGLRLEIQAAKPLTADEFPEAAGLKPGTVLESALKGKHPRFLIQTGNGILEVTELQLQGKKAMPAEAFLRGKDLTGVCFERKEPIGDTEE